MFELHAIERACQRVPGSLKRISLIDPADLASPATWNVSDDADPFTFLPDKSAYTFEKDLLSGRLEGDTDTGNAAGDFLTYRLTATIRAIRPTVEALRAKLMNRRVHVRVIYHDDLQRLLPFMRLWAKDDTGPAWNAQQGYTFTGVTRRLMPGPGLGGNIATPVDDDDDVPTPGPGGVTLVDISTTSSTWSYTIPVGKWLVGWEVKSNAAQEVSLGTTPGGNELDGPVWFAAGAVWVGDGNSLPTFTAHTVYFSGLAGTNSIRLWLLG